MVKSRYIVANWPRIIKIITKWKILNKLFSDARANATNSWSSATSISPEIGQGRFSNIGAAISLIAKAGEAQVENYFRLKINIVVSFPQLMTFYSRFHRLNFLKISVFQFHGTMFQKLIIVKNKKTTVMMSALRLVVAIESAVLQPIIYCKENFGTNIQMFSIVISILIWVASGLFLIIMPRDQILKLGHI